jgi:hypothetical protein
MFIERHKVYVDHPVADMRAMTRARLRGRKQRKLTLNGRLHIHMRDRFKHELKKNENVKRKTSGADAYDKDCEAKNPELECN